MLFTRLSMALMAMFLLFSTPVFSQDTRQIRVIEVSKDFAKLLLKERPDKVVWFTSVTADVGQLVVDADLISWVSARYHETTGRCGGFIDVTDEQVASTPALMSLQTFGKRKPKKQTGTWPNLGEKDRGIVAALTEIDGKNIEEFVKTYSSKFVTRKADTPTGAEAPKWLQETWLKMAQLAERTDVTVDLMPAPKGYAQNSVRITLPGTDPTAPTIVIGAHLDSINSGFFTQGDAPGADDDASGIAALTEIYRVLLKKKEKLKSTIEFFGYAAEEVGLLGSRVIAEDYSKAGKLVKAVMQLDMIAWPSDRKKVTFMRDYTDDGLTLWTQQLYGLYIGKEFQEEVCDYACSDHASWHRYSYKTVMPFESKFKEMNNRIHSEFDLWDEQLDADYAALFAKLGYAFVVTLAR